jgi:hypothetical protein
MSDAPGPRAPGNDAIDDDAVVGDDLAGDCRAVAYRQQMGSDVSLDRALDLDIAGGHEVAGDGEILAQHIRRSLRRWLRRGGGRRGSGGRRAARGGARRAAGRGLVRLHVDRVVDLGLREHCARPRCTSWGSPAGH